MLEPRPEEVNALWNSRGVDDQVVHINDIANIAYLVRNLIMTLPRQLDETASLSTRAALRTS